MHVSIQKISNSVWSVGVVDRHGLSKRSRSRVLLDTGRIILLLQLKLSYIFIIFLGFTKFKKTKGKKTNLGFFVDRIKNKPRVLC